MKSDGKLETCSEVVRTHLCRYLRVKWLKERKLNGSIQLCSLQGNTGRFNSHVCSFLFRKIIFLLWQTKYYVHMVNSFSKFVRSRYCYELFWFTVKTANPTLINYSLWQHYLHLWLQPQQWIVHSRFYWILQKILKT